MKSRDLHRIVRYLLGVGTIGYGVLSLIRSRPVADLTHTDEDIVHEWAMRDIGSGLQILTAENPAPALITRALYDFNDGVRLVRTRPSVAPLAFLWGLLAIVALLTRPPAPDEV